MIYFQMNKNETMLCLNNIKDYKSHWVAIPIGEEYLFTQAFKDFFKRIDEIEKEEGFEVFLKPIDDQPYLSFVGKYKNVEFLVSIQEERIFLKVWYMVKK